MTMWRRVWLCVVATGIAAVAWAAAVEPAAQPPAGILAPLRVGRNVALRDAGPAYELTTFTRETPAGPYRVVEVAQDYVVLQDLTALHDVRIPVHAVKSITNVNR